MSHEEALTRIAELEEALARKTLEAEMHKMTVKALMPPEMFEMPTEEEVRRMMTDTGGPHIRELIAELEREVA